MDDTIRLGVVGLRNVGMGHVRRAMKLDGVAVHALADTDASRLDGAKSEAPSAKTYSDADEMFRAAGLDAVVLAVPNHLHAPLAISAMEHGLHVLVEKPISRSAPEAEEMIRVHDRTGRALMVGMNQRFSPAVYAARAAIVEGAIGRVQYVKARWNRRQLAGGVWQRGDWFLTREKSGGGPVIDIGVHKLDLAMHLIGYPRVESVDAACFHGIGREFAAREGKEYLIEDSSVAMLRLEGGAVLHLESAYFLNDREMETSDVVIYGTRGAFTSGSRREFGLFAPDGDGIRAIDPPTPEVAARSCVEHFTNVLSGREELIATPEQGLEMMRLIEGIYESAEAGRPVSLMEEVACH